MNKLEISFQGRPIPGQTSWKKGDDYLDDPQHTVIISASVRKV